MSCCDSVCEQISLYFLPRKKICLAADSKPLPHVTPHMDFVDLLTLDYFTTWIH